MLSQSTTRRLRRRCHFYENNPPDFGEPCLRCYCPRASTIGHLSWHAAINAGHTGSHCVIISRGFAGIFSSIVGFT